MRLWLGLAPFSNSLISNCPLCSEDIKNDQWHAFSCVKLRRKAVTVRHDAILYLLVKYAQSNAVLARVEPKDSASLVPDGEFILPHLTALIDVSGTHPSAPSYRPKSVRDPGSAILSREKIKNNKYALHSLHLGANFFPFVIDTYGAIGKHALAFIKSVDGAFHPGLGLPPSSRMQMATFCQLMSVEWQKHNANILLQWDNMTRSKTLRKRILDDALVRLR